MHDSYDTVFLGFCLHDKKQVVNRNEIITTDSVFVFACLANSSITIFIFLVILIAKLSFKLLKVIGVSSTYFEFALFPNLIWFLTDNVT